MIAVVIAVVVVVGQDLRVDAVVARADTHVIDAGDFTNVIEMS